MDSVGETGKGTKDEVGSWSWCTTIRFVRQTCMVWRNSSCCRCSPELPIQAHGKWSLLSLTGYFCSGCTVVLAGIRRGLAAEGGCSTPCSAEALRPHCQHPNPFTYIWPWWPLFRQWLPQFLYTGDPGGSGPLFRILEPAAGPLGSPLRPSGPAPKPS